jgi:hypothetical protein
MEVHQQSDVLMRQAQVRQKLGFVNREQLFDRFNLYDDCVLHNYVEPVATIKLHFLVDNRKRFLFLNSEAQLLELKYQALLISRFQQTWT